ncbi:hypothetical protein [Ancylobacter radicis]|uniref:DUF2190 domain-containing protein n=1 Tax=Ancylobacter radicis TaxID=2836179 RepID=A0ABS5R798_9HYPH|nr:hypothetical protein [Ancylobacter radicis]MBS9476684.1 hypothetical protein [Ancylobacter radicis]
MQVAPNAYQIETNAGGLIFMGQAGPQALKRAAELTIAKGYTHFRLAGAGIETGSQVTGIIPGQTRAQATVVGNTVYGSAYTAPATVVRGPTERVTATVLMFHSTDPEAEGAFDAAQVLKGDAG